MQEQRTCCKPRHAENCPDTRSSEQVGADSPLEPSEGVLSCRQLVFGLLVSRTVREQISVVLGHRVCGIVLCGLRKLMEINAKRKIKKVRQAGGVEG